MLDLLLITTLGFLGSFGHCAGMCGPITAAFALSQQEQGRQSWRRQVYFHTLLNLGRIAILRQGKNPTFRAARRNAPRPRNVGFLP